MKADAHVSNPIAKGGTVSTGGKRFGNVGTFFEPTMVTGATADMKVGREETFDPLAVLFKFDTEEKAIERADDTEYGLARYFYSQDLYRVFRVMAGLAYGLLGVNEGGITTEAAPFAGTQERGVGDEGSRYGRAG